MGGSSAPRPRPSPRRVLSAGIVAHNEEATIERAIRSLTSQVLPPKWEWGAIWVVASGCTDRTVEVVSRCTAADGRVHLEVEERRNGKAHALRAVFARATGDALVLLNGDAVAAPGAIAALLESAGSVPVGPPLAVMGRPFPMAGSPHGRWANMLDFLWDLHHRFHAMLAREGGGAHLSDELLLLRLPVVVPLPDGAINDGSFLGVWLRQHGGVWRYAPEARVETAVPVRLGDHLRQRRRIWFGNVQVRRLLGASPSTLLGRAVHHPRWAARFLREAARSRPDGFRDLVWLVASEVMALTLAAWDLTPPQPDHVRWTRIAAPSPTPPAARSPPSLSPATAERLRRLQRVAQEFGTPIPTDELVMLLPDDAPVTTAELLSLAPPPPNARGDVGPERSPAEDARESTAARRTRGAAYLAVADRICTGALAPAAPWLHCLAVTGSVAYGAPEPGDDLDLFVVTRRGSAWWFLAFAYAVQRVRRWRGGAAREPELCYNYVVDRPTAMREFAEDRGLLFAREALTARVLRGDGFYRSLLLEAPWIAARFPRLYARRSGPAGASDTAPASLGVRLLNLGTFPWLAAYLQLVGLARNARYRRTGAADRAFRTITTPGRVVLASERFERIRSLYDGPVWAGDGAPTGDITPGAVRDPTPSGSWGTP